MLHYRANPHPLVITQRPDMDHVIRADRKITLFVINSVGIPAAGVKQCGFPRHTGFQVGHLTATVTDHLCVAVPPTKNVALFGFPPFIAGLPFVRLIVNKVEHGMIAGSLNLIAGFTHHMQRHLCN